MVIILNDRIHKYNKTSQFVIIRIYHFFWSIMTHVVIYLGLSLLIGCDILPCFCIYLVYFAII